MSDEILNLEPKKFWYYFNEICKIPHGSGNEAALAEYITCFARERGLEYKKDEKGNVVVRKPATTGASRCGVILQGHLDMVCESEPNATVDFTKDPIRPIIKDGWVWADCTTLGADNGVAVAAALAILDSKDLKHGPLECLFTVEEEVGLNGAAELAPDMLTGKTLLNLDCEPEGIFFIGCAGGEYSNAKIGYKRVAVPGGFVGMEITVTGLLGGHSGIEIHKQRANSNKLLARVLGAINSECGLRLAQFNGGTKDNVIPSHSVATIAVLAADKSKVENIVAEYQKIFSDEFKVTDPGCKLNIKSAQLTDVISQEDGNKVLSLLEASPHGVLMMSFAIPGLVQTSCNLAVVKTAEDHCFAQYSVRSSVASETNWIRNQITALAKLVGASFETTGAYPGWQPNVDSPVLKVAKGVYQEIFNSEPEVTAVHAGLECGLIMSKFNEIDALSFGPNMKDIHSTAERVEIGSVQRFWNLLTKLLEKLAGN